MNVLGLRRPAELPAGVYAARRRLPRPRLPRFLRLASPRAREWTATVVLLAAAMLDVLLNYPPPRDWTFYASVVAAAALLLRVRFPRTVLLVTLPGLYAGTASVAAMVALYGVTRSRPPGRQTWTATALVGIGMFVSWPLSDFYSETTSQHTQDFIHAVVLSGGPAALGLLAQTRETLQARIAELATLRDHERELHSQTVLARERARIAREMHDVVSHQAGLIAVQAGALEVTARDPEVRQTAKMLRGLAVATLEELRTMILVLRAAGAGPTELVPQPRLGDLPRLVAESEVDAVLHLLVPEDAVLPEPVERAAYRTVQEALTNVRKHAPGAWTEVSVVLDGDRLLVAVENAPPGRAGPAGPARRRARHSGPARAGDPARRNPAGRADAGRRFRRTAQGAGRAALGRRPGRDHRDLIAATGSRFVTRLVAYRTCGESGWSQRDVRGNPSGPASARPLPRMGRVGQAPDTAGRGESAGAVRRRSPARRELHPPGRRPLPGLLEAPGDGRDAGAAAAAGRGARSRRAAGRDVPR
ncbi:hypothetical protein GXW82_05945 [Streptacidiphilus sp. 4-A2]|nr:hypothetical protein [Streptacidiphilus sp. 4-A2]